MKGVCKLCDKEKKLSESHIIPKFVFKWMQKSGGKYFRNPLNPNARMQDGFKPNLLCKNCEQIFGTNEKWFSENIFYPFLNKNKNTIKYGKELSKFIISVLWRILLLSKETLTNETYKELSLEVLEEWKKYLFENISPNKYTKIHLIFIPDSPEDEVQLHKYITRYFHRSSDGGLIELENTFIVFAKFSRFFIFAEIVKSEQNFLGTEISLNYGITNPNQHIVNEKVSCFFTERAFDVYELMEKTISDNQKKKINTSIKKDIGSFLKTDLGKSVLKDVISPKDPNLQHIFKYTCDCCTKEIEEPEGFLLRTFEFIQAKDYWKFIFSKQNIGIDEIGLKYRAEYFKVIASYKTPWIICNDCIPMFWVEDLENTKKYTQIWLEKKGDYLPPKYDDFRKYITQEEIEKIIFSIVTIK